MNTLKRSTLFTPFPYSPPLFLSLAVFLFRRCTWSYFLPANRSRNMRSSLGSQGWEGSFPGGSWDPYGSTQSSGAFSFRGAATRPANSQQEYEAVRDEERLQTEISSQWLRFKSIAPNGRASRQATDDWKSAIRADNNTNEKSVRFQDDTKEKIKDDFDKRKESLKAEIAFMDVLDNLRGDIADAKKELSTLSNVVRKLNENTGVDATTSQERVTADDVRELKEEIARLRRAVLGDETKDTILTEAGKNRSLLVQIEKDQATDTARVCELLTETTEANSRRVGRLENALKSYGDEQQRLLAAWKEKTKQEAKEPGFPRIKQEAKEIRSSFVVPKFLTEDFEEEIKSTEHHVEDSDNLEEPLGVWPWNKDKVYNIDSDQSSTAENSECHEGGPSNASKSENSRRK